VSRFWTATIAVTLCAACSGSTPEPREPEATPAPVVEPAEPEPLDAGPPEVESDATPEGDACDQSADCEGEQQCRGPAGCDSEWACGPPRECGEEHVAWCGCNGFTFYAPENCPGQRYVHSGACEAIGEVDTRPLEEVEGNVVCQSDDDCRRGWICTGTAGCSTLWTCVRRVRMRPRCRRVRGEPDRYCGCSGDTFEATTTCPGQPYLHAGYCEGDEPPPLVAEAEAAPDAGVAPPPPAATEPPAEPAGPRVCVRNRDCPRGLVCAGDEGCTSDWHCVRPPDRCIADTQYFCSCTGETFVASMTCPGRPHRHRGSCLPEEEAQ